MGASTNVYETGVGSLGEAIEMLIGDGKADNAAGRSSSPEPAGDDYDQEEALLGTQRRRGQDPREESRKKPARRFPVPGTSFINPGIGLVLGLIAILGLVLSLAYFRGYSLGPTGGRQGVGVDDYVLDPRWRFGAAPRIREYKWVVRDRELNPDGVYRPMMVINDRFPGPLIEVNEGDTVVVHVDNQARNATSIHWHGLYQNGTNWMDGTVGVTQCPIAPGARFTYRFKVEGQSGTYWYHAHHGVQSSDGLLGPLVIHAKDEREAQRLDYATDRILMVSDHYHEPSATLLMAYLASDNENAEPVPDGALINGRGIRDCSKVPHRKCDNGTAGVGVPRLDLEAGKSHRLRIINVGAFAEFQISIDEHEFAVTEVDGTDVLPAYYHRLNISPAQRYSIVLPASDRPRQSYWLRAKMVTACFAEKNPDLEPEVWAAVSYVRKGQVVATTPPPASRDWGEVVELECRDMNTTELVPVHAVSAPERADAAFFLRSNFEIGAWRLSRGFFNQSSWRPDVQRPSLVRAVDGLSTRKRPFVGGTSAAAFVNGAAFDVSRELVVQTTGIQVLDVLVSNFDDGSHPLHLHGYKYFVLAQGLGYPEANLSSTLDLRNPLRRDTATVEAFGWILLRLVADNPGMWAFHCHVSWHAEAGLLMQFLTRADAVAGMEIPEPNRALCGAPLKELEKGMCPSDEVFAGHAT